MQFVQKFLRALEREGGNDDIAAALERLADREIEFIHRLLRRLVQAIGVGRLHHDDVGVRRRRGRAQQGTAGVAEIA